MGEPRGTIGEGGGAFMNEQNRTQRTSHVTEPRASLIALQLASLGPMGPRKFPWFPPMLHVRGRPWNTSRASDRPNASCTCLALLRAFLRVRGENKIETGGKHLLLRKQMVEVLKQAGLRQVTTRILFYV